MRYNPERALPFDQEIDFISQISRAVDITIKNAANPPAQIWSKDGPIPGTDFPSLQEINVGGGLLAITDKTSRIGDLGFTIIAGTQRGSSITSNGIFYPAGSSMHSSITLATEVDLRQLDRDLFDKCTELENATVGDPITTLNGMGLMRKVVFNGVEMIVQYNQSTGLSIKTNRRVFEYGEDGSQNVVNMDELIGDCKGMFVLLETLMERAGYKEIFYYDFLSPRRHN